MAASTLRLATEKVTARVPGDHTLVNWKKIEVGKEDNLWYKINFNIVLDGPDKGGIKYGQSRFYVNHGDDEFNSLSDMKKKGEKWVFDFENWSKLLFELVGAYLNKYLVWICFDIYILKELS